MIMVVTIDYTNHRGERAFRRIIPHSVYYSSNNRWHGAGWILMAMDQEKKAFREFAMRNIHKWEDYIG